jgi:hypothetical protein
VNCISFKSFFLHPNIQTCHCHVTKGPHPQVSYKFVVLLFSICAEIKKEWERILTKQIKDFSLAGLNFLLVMDKQMNGFVKPW